MKEELNNQELQKAGGGDAYTDFTLPKPSHSNDKHAPIIRHCPQCGEVEVFIETTTICPKCGKRLIDQA